LLSKEEGLLTKRKRSNQINYPENDGRSSSRKLRSEGDGLLTQATQGECESSNHDVSHGGPRFDGRRITYENHHHLSHDRRASYKIPYREVVVVVVLLGARLNITEGGSLILIQGLGRYLSA